MHYDDSVSIGDKLIQGMQEFADALDSSKPVTEQLTCRKVELQLRPMPYDPKREMFHQQ